VYGSLFNITPAYKEEFAGRFDADMDHLAHVGWVGWDQHLGKQASISPCSHKVISKVKLATPKNQRQDNRLGQSSCCVPRNERRPLLCP